MGWKWFPKLRKRSIANSIATALGLATLILLVGPVSGAHLGPAVSLTDWVLARRHSRGAGLGGRELAAFQLWALRNR